MREMDFRISHLNTQKNLEGIKIYNYRDFDNVRDFVKCISTGYQGRKPIEVYQYGLIDTNPDALVESIQQSADLFSKNTGILLRGLFVQIDKVCINDSAIIKSLANEFAKYILYRGFILKYIIYDMDSYFVIIYLINPINYVDGSKYKTNNTDVLEDEYRCLCQCVNYIRGNCTEYDFSTLETYPLPY